MEPRYNGTIGPKIITLTLTLTVGSAILGTTESYRVSTLGLYQPCFKETFPKIF